VHQHEGDRKAMRRRITNFIEGKNTVDNGKE
jgi:hypothetical protein